MKHGTVSVDGSIPLGASSSVDTVMIKLMFRKCAVFESKHSWPHCFMHIMMSSNGNIFRVTGPLCGGRWIPHKGQWRGALLFWTNGWVNNRSNGDLGRHRAYYDVTVMTIACPGLCPGHQLIRWPVDDQMIGHDTLVKSSNWNVYVLISMIVGGYVSDMVISW